MTRQSRGTRTLRAVPPAPEPLAHTAPEPPAQQRGSLPPGVVPPVQRPPDPQHGSLPPGAVPPLRQPPAQQRGTLPAGTVPPLQVPPLQVPPLQVPPLQVPPARQRGSLPPGAIPPAPVPPAEPPPQNGHAAPPPQNRHAAPPPQDSSEDPADGGDQTEVWALVTATQAGDMSAFGQLFELYKEQVFRYVLFRTGDRMLAEDITNETFLRALRRIESVSYQGRDIGAWFVTIARNLVLDHVKSSRYRLEHSTAEISDVGPTTGGPEEQVLDGATHDELLRCVAKLNPDQQECIAHRFLQGLSVAETARLMGRNEGAVKALQHRAVRRLAQLLPKGLR